MDAALQTSDLAHDASRHSMQRLVSLGADSPLFALDRLNSWLRAKQDGLRVLQSKFREIVYWTKTHAILAAAKEMHVEFERLVVPIKCRRCDGSGIWYSDYDIDAEHPERCRGCDATGIAKLRFVGSTIGPIRWHTPRHKWRSASMDHYLGLPQEWCEADEEFKISEGWSVNKVGKPMTVAEVERDMLAILHAYPKDVAFSIDFHHHAKIMPQWGCPNVLKAEEWLRARCEANS